MSAADHALSPLAARAAAHAVQTLAPGQALTLRPARAGVLHVQRGAVWATRRGPHAANAGAAGGDDVLRAGQRLRLHAGEVLVLEPIAVPGTPAQRVALHWRPKWPARPANCSARCAMPCAPAASCCAARRRGPGTGWGRAGMRAACTMPDTKATLLIASSACWTGAEARFRS